MTPHPLEWPSPMKLVLLEALIVLVAMRAVLSLIGHAPSWPTPLWDAFAAVALLAATSIFVQALRNRRPRQRRLTPPHIPLERIAPFRTDALLVRTGTRGEKLINLN